MYLKRDALAGTVTGVMAVPLTVGICLMSDYPVMIGLYTAIFAGIVSFITYLIKPGNYTGMPGVAAGLAPAMALGVMSFGMENMPFVILLTSIFQIIVWKFRLEKYILRIVPHYLVEGLLAGVGLKIALKFVPFLFELQSGELHNFNDWIHIDWLNFNRDKIAILSIISFTIFILLYKYYKKKMPALPYFIIMATSIGISFFIDLPKISIESIPFKLSLPLPHFMDMSSSESSLMLLKMVGFAMMLGTIDVIEQVMSNVAIEKMDPLERECDTNNSLLAIWIANLGATLFGGMTNLDGLAKSTTNTVAGAVTKLSNLFTAAFLFLVVLFPIVITTLPEYALGIIMVYSGWKMVANISHVRAEGRYALILAAVCGLLVFKLGIFEGLLIVLTAHAIIQFIFMRRLGKSNQEVWNQFKSSFTEKTIFKLDNEDALADPQVPIYNKLLQNVNSKNLEGIMFLYHNNAVLVPSFSSRIRRNKEEIKDYYATLFKMDGLSLAQEEIYLNKTDGQRIDSGVYEISWKNGGSVTSYKLNFIMVIENDKIIAHQSSHQHSNNISISRWVDEKDNGNFVM
ncbi:SulP family inorganic anion transporter [Tenacibaculum ovolyticum]|uniref:SulP family inorganic anion transporter n=1 Tax=Tenacibaculum ovolyticum TaxID=104270 RepID=UPI001EED0F92|nr:SulP family inorganic anion transporter [Tenacibaculum ovolyticum]